MNSTTEPKKALTISVFSRSPIPGRTKTRLIPVLGQLGAAKLHELMLERTLATVYQAQVGPVCLVVTGRHVFFEKLTERFEIDVVLQTDGSLGKKMFSEVERVLARDSAVCLVGSDCPGIVTQDFLEVHKALSEDKDLVIGPSNDGGYYLIAMSKPYDFLFSQMRWGEASVFEMTLDQATRENLKIHLLETKSDIDVPGDLAKLPEGWDV